MNRFTAIYRPQTQQALPGALRKALEDLLAGELAQRDYRLATVGEMPGGLVAAELACPWAKDVVSERLAGAGAGVGYTLEKVGWGWLQSGRLVFELVDERSGALLHDPLVDEPPQTEEQRTYSYGGGQAASLALVLLGLVAVLSLVIGGLVNAGLLAWLRANLPMLALSLLLGWLLLRAFGGLVTPWSYLRRIDADTGGLILVSLFNNESRLPWSSITELQYIDQRLDVFQGRQITHIPFRERLGMADRLTLLRTIVQRADLLFVGGKVGEFSYRKFDA